MFNTALVNVLLVNVCEPDKVVTEALIEIPLALTVIPSPPCALKVTVPDVPPPVKPSPAITPSISPVPLPPPPPRPLVNVYSTIDSPKTFDILPLTKLELNVYTESVVSV